MISKIISQLIRRKLLTSIALVAVVGGGYLGLNGLGDNATVQYATAAVTKGTIVNSISGGGVLSLENEVDLSFDSNGRITNIYVEEGQEVERGDWLARINSTELQLQVAQARVTLADKEKQLAELLGEATSAELRSFETAVETARLNLEETKKNVEIARLNLEETKQNYEELIANEPPEQREIDAAKNKADELEFSYLDLKEEYEKMKNGYGELEIKKTQIAYDKALASYNDANQDYIDLLNNPSATQAELQAAQNKVDEKYAAYQEAQANEALKLAEYNEDPDNSVKQAAYQLAQAQRASAYTAWQNAIDDYNNIQSNPPSAQGSIENARIKKNELEIKYLEAQDELYKKQNGYTQAELKSMEIKVNDALSDWEDAKEAHEDLINNELPDELTVIKAKPDELMVAKAENEVSKAEVSYLEAQERLEDAKRGADANSIAVLETQVAKAKIDLAEAQNNLAGALLVSPVNGIVISINQEVGEKAGERSSSGSGSAGSSFMTVVSKDYLATITLNEVDIAKIKLGQLATLNFDAVDELALTGKVIEIDSLGSVTQGVVNYDVTIALDTVDERLRPNMTTDASIIVDRKSDVVYVPNSAIQTQGGSSYYVEVPEEADMSVALANVSGAVFKNTPQRRQVEVGVFNDEFTEIVSGLQEGDLVVTRTIQPTSAQTTQTQQNSSLGIPGVTGGGGGGFRGGGGFGR